MNELCALEIRSFSTKDNLVARILENNLAMECVKLIGRKSPKQRASSFMRLGMGWFTGWIGFQPHHVQGGLNASLQLIGERQTQSARVGTIMHTEAMTARLGLASKLGEKRELIN